MEKNFLSILLAVAVGLSLLAFSYYVVFNQPDPTRSFSISFEPEEIYEGQETVFSFESDMVVKSFFWAIEDSIYNSDHPTHIFDEPGTYSVRLTVNGIEKETFIDIKEREIQVRISPKDTTINLNRSIRLKDLTDPGFVKDREWYVNGTIVSKEKSYIREFKSPGDYIVKLVVNGKYSSESNVSVNEPVDVSSEDLKTYETEAKVRISATRDSVKVGGAVTFFLRSDQAIEDPTWSCTSCTRRFEKGDQARFVFTSPGWKRVYLNYSYGKPASKYKRVYVIGEKSPSDVSSPSGKEALISDIERGLNQLLNASLSMQERKSVITRLKSKLGNENLNVTILNENRQEDFHSYTLNLLIDPDQSFNRISVSRDQSNYRNNKLADLKIRHQN